jgi:hypothetical protein
MDDNVTKDGSTQIEPRTTSLLLVNWIAARVKDGRGSNGEVKTTVRYSRFVQIGDKAAQIPLKHWQREVDELLARHQNCHAGSR